MVYKGELEKGKEKDISATKEFKEFMKSKEVKELMKKAKLMGYSKAGVTELLTHIYAKRKALDGVADKKKVIRDVLRILLRLRPSWVKKQFKKLKDLIKLLGGLLKLL